VTKKERLLIRLRLASLIQKLRKEKNLSLFQASIRINISPIEILKYELALSSPSSILIAKMIQIYKPSSKLYLSFCCFPKGIDS